MNLREYIDGFSHHHKPDPNITEEKVNEILQELWEESKNPPTEMIWTGSKEDLEKFLEKLSQL